MITHVTSTVPYVGMPATVLLYTDASPAVVTKVNRNSVVIQEVAVIESSRRQLNPGEPYPRLRWDGDVETPVSAPRRFMRTRNGYAQGSIKLLLGKSFKYTDYSF